MRMQLFIQLNCVPVVAILVIVSNYTHFCTATLIIISEVTNETVFSTEEAGIDSASAYGLKGHLVLSNPLDACGTVSPPPLIDDLVVGTKNWILIATVNLYANEDSCSLAKKTKNAQFAGYSGIILRHLGSNDTRGVIPRFIGFDWMGVKIYACVVGDDIGSFLMEKFSYPSRYYVAFENEPYYPIRLLANFMIVGFLGIVVVLLLIRLFHYLYFSVTTRVVERQRIRKSLLSESQLRKLPVLHWNSSIPQDTCTICLNLFEDEVSFIRVLPCSHVFHKDCVDKWLLKESRKCPNCKGRVLFPNEHYSYSSDSDSGDERTPLLRRRVNENYRFVETLTESHNTRALAQPQNQYNLHPDSATTTSSKKNITTTNSTRTPKVTFAPSTSRRPAATSQAFVLPMSKPIIKSPSKKPKSIGINNSSTCSNSTAIVTHHDELSSSSCSEETLVEFHEITNSDEFDGVKSFTESTDSKSLSFHSCHGFDSDGSENQLYHSLSSQNT